MVTKYDVGRNRDRNWTLVWHCGDRGLFAIWTCSFCVKNLFPFPLATAFWMGIVTTNRRSGVKMFLSVITAPIVLAHIINFLIRRWHVNRIFILQIRSATPIQDMNTSAPIYKKVKKLAALHLTVMTMPIQKAVTSGNRNNEFYRETARSNRK